MSIKGQQQEFSPTNAEGDYFDDSNQCVSCSMALLYCFCALLGKKREGQDSHIEIAGRVSSCVVRDTSAYRVYDILFDQVFSSRLLQ